MNKLKLAMGLAAGLALAESVPVAAQGRYPAEAPSWSGYSKQKGSSGQRTIPRFRKQAKNRKKMANKSKRANRK